MSKSVIGGRGAILTGVSDDDKIKWFGDKVRTHGFQKGYDPKRNPGGRVKAAEALKVVGLTARELSAEMIQKALDMMRDGPSRELEYAMTWLTSYVLQWAKPKEHVELTGGFTPEQVQLFEALKLTPHERRIAAQDTTAIEDDAALAQIESDGESIGD